MKKQFLFFRNRGKRRGGAVLSAANGRIPFSTESIDFSEKCLRARYVLCSRVIIELVPYRKQ